MLLKQQNRPRVFCGYYSDNGKLKILIHRKLVDGSLENTSMEKEWIQLQKL